jgi:flagellar motor protein MotB
MNPLNRKRNFQFILIFILFFSSGLDQLFGQGVEISLIGEERVSVKPRQIITLSFQINNKTSTKRNFITKTILPENWHLNTSDISLEIDPNETKPSIVSFMVAQTALAQDYEISFTVRDSTEPSVSAKKSFYVTVLPDLKINLGVISRPKYVIAGDDFKARFSVSNRGNSECKVAVEVFGEQSEPVKLDTSEIMLKPGEMKYFGAKFETNPRIKEKIYSTLLILAKVLEPKELNVSASTSVSIEVFPGIFGGARSDCHSIPLIFTLRGVTEKNKYGFQLDVESAGSLYDNDDYKLDLFLRTPDIKEKSSMFWLRDEYRLSYIRKNLQVHLGDRSYSLSNLTEAGRAGIGAEVDYNYNNFFLKTFQLNNRWVTYPDNAIGVHLSYAEKVDTINDQMDLYRIGINYLNRNEMQTKNQIYSISGFNRSFPLANVDLEYGLSSGTSGNGSAYRLNLTGNNDMFNYGLQLGYGSPLYRGTQRDMSYRSASLGFRPIKIIGLNAGYNESESNVNLDSNLYYAPKNRSYQFGVNGNLIINASLSYRNFRWEDRLHPDNVTTDEAFQFSTGYNSQSLGSISISADYGKMVTQHLLLENIYKRVSLTMRPNLFDNYTIDFIGHYSDSKSNLPDRDQKNFGGGINTFFNISPVTKLSFNLHFTHFISPFTSYDFNSMNLKFEQWLFQTHKLTVTGITYSYLNNFSNNGLFALMVEYRIPLQFCITRRTTLGIIKGRVYDINEPSRGISKMDLILDDFSTVTDEDGNFIFKDLKPGEYYLELNKNTLGPEKTTTIKMPVDIFVKGGEEAVIDIGIVSGAQVKGKVLVYDFEEAGGLDTTKLSLIERMGLENCSLILKNGRPDIFTIKTDRDGNFVTSFLPPGKWHLKIIDGALPEYHYYEVDSLEIDLKPGDRKEILIRVLPRKRPVKIITKLDTVVTITPIKKDTFAVVTPVVEKLPVGVTKNLYLDDRDRTLTPDTREYLDKLANYIKTDKNLRVKIIGHTDNIGNLQQKQQISQQRANQMRDYLRSSGVPAGNIITQAKGDREPIASNATPEGRKRNRRVDVTIERLR